MREGEGLMEIAGKNHVVRKHDFIFLPPGVEHAISNSGLVDLVFLVITSPVTDDGKDAWPWQRASPPELFWSKRFRAGRYGEVSTPSALALRRAAEHFFKLLDRPFQPSIKEGPRLGVYASLETAENGCCRMRERTNRHATLRQHNKSRTVMQQPSA